MTARPIIFTAESVRAILAGTKTQTRRVVDVAKVKRFIDKNYPSDTPIKWACDANPHILCPYGDPVCSDTLWVRETWANEDARDIGGSASHVIHRATASEAEAALVKRWRSPLYMPRWASRLTLRVTDVRVERLHDITEEDARAEGCEPRFEIGLAEFLSKAPITSTHRIGFKHLWQRINGKRAPWASNPWVRRVCFEVAR